MRGLLDLKSDPTASCRTDSSAHTFKVHSNDHLQELFSYVLDLGEALVPCGGFLPVRKGKHFSQLYIHPTGLSFSCSRSALSHMSDKPVHNENLAMVEIPGQAWGLLNAQERNSLIVDMYGWDGYFRTTRWDPQITILDPPVSVPEIVDDVQAGNLWAKGFAVQRPMLDKDLNGNYTGAPTQYFGSRQSDVMARIYDKAFKDKWSVPALRAELQLRGQAATNHFKRLATRCGTQTELEPLFVNAEELTVKDALAQHLDLRDTSRWAGRRKPKNWAKVAPKVKWWSEALDEAHDPIQVTFRAEQDLDKTVGHAAHQYGRKLFMHMAMRAAQLKVQPVMAMIEFYGRCGQHIRKEDLAEVLRMIPEEHHEETRKLFENAASFGAYYSEHVVVQTNPKTPLG